MIKQSWAGGLMCDSVFQQLSDQVMRNQPRPCKCGVHCGASASVRLVGAMLSAAGRSDVITVGTGPFGTNAYKDWVFERHAQVVLMFVDKCHNLPLCMKTQFLVLQFCFEVRTSHLYRMKQ
jgi:hypothetical protein